MPVAVLGLNELVRDLNRLDRELGGEAVDEALLAGAFVLEAEVKVQIQRQGLIDTGFMVNSVYSANRKRSGYGAAASAAKGVNPTGDLLPPERPGPRQALVSVGAEYAIHHEYGTRFVRARPFMRPALDGKRDEIVRAVEWHVDRLIRRVVG